MSNWSILLTLSFLAQIATGAERFFDFGEVKENDTPPGFRSIVSGLGKPGEWKVLLDDAPTAFPALTPNAPKVSKRPVLAQLSEDSTDEHSPMLIYEGETFGDFTFSAQFKLVSGSVEQMAGLAFRIQDERNYYYVRASALGDSFYFFKVVNGLRSPPIGAKVEIPAGVWHEMSVTCEGNQIRAFLNGRELIPAMTDQSFLTGQVGFWTKSDAVSYFADARIRYTPREPAAQSFVNEVLKKYSRLIGLKVYAPAKDKEVRIIASNNSSELGQAAKAAEKDVIARSIIYHGKDNEKDAVIVTMPLRDNNGETFAAVKVLMKSFPGQTEKNAIARALPIVKQLQARITKPEELLQ